MRAAQENLFARLDRAWAAHDDDFAAADGDAIGELDDRAFGAKSAPGKLVRRRDAIGFGDAGQHPKSFTSKAPGVPTPARMVWTAPVVRCTLKPRSVIRATTFCDLFFGSVFLHCDDHAFSRLSWLERRLPWRPRFCEASSFFCIARITSMIRS